MISHFFIGNHELVVRSDAIIGIGIMETDYYLYLINGKTLKVDASQEEYDKWIEASTSKE